ncbi:EthD domain-containing protein [Telluria mixta]|uniref:EthD domain-containing protein n=1 Tax=Telluria mixta TaxID=34071 RepID=A0ABT2C1E4_9BURK|nr:EthD domain-containing protein [Telluria mixta]MCS0631200.1 EthD domain-containing protein [Telluria mixta]WEM95739.1 EthD domain-containing protein [Telluria mixta]
MTALAQSHCVHPFASPDTAFAQPNRAMLKVILVPRRNPQMTRPQFFDHLTNHHAPLVKSVPEFTRFLKRYVQNHTRLPAEGADCVTPYRRATDRDSVIELWFDDADGLHRGLAEPRYQELIRPDEARFNDLSSLIILATRESGGLAADGQPSDCKLFDVLKRRNDISREEFAVRWERHCDLLQARGLYRGSVRKMTRNVVVPDDVNPFGHAADFDGVMETWLGTFADAGAIAKLQSEDQEVAESLARFVDRAGSFSLLAVERPIINAPAWTSA